MEQRLHRYPRIKSIRENPLNPCNQCSPRGKSAFIRVRSCEFVFYPDYSTPFVLGTPVPLILAALFNATANALKSASILW